MLSFVTPAFRRQEVRLYPLLAAGTAEAVEKLEAARMSRPQGEPHLQCFFMSFWLIICFIVLCVSTAAAQTREYEIKAEFLERFTRFIEWPETSTVAEPNSPFNLCIIGKNHYGSYLHDLTSSAKVHNKTILIKEISALAQIEPCNLLFISESEKTKLTAILTYTGGKPILTISDSPGFAEQGVLINFFEYDGFVRFEINPQAVQKSGLKFSSRLFKLARLIGQRRSQTINNAAP